MQVSSNKQQAEKQHFNNSSIRLTRGEGEKMKITKNSSVNNWIEYTLINKHGMKVSFLNYGGIITKIIVPDKDGKMENVVLAYRNYKDYEKNSAYFGAIIGRVAGRIENAVFEISGDKYKLKANDGKHHLHGGDHGFHHVVCKVDPFQTQESVGVKLFHTSADNEGGYPGCVDVVVTYTLTNNNQLIIDYDATSTKDTILTLTNHTYFNLTGDLKDTVENHLVTINSEKFIELNEELIPTGKLVHVTDTPFDFQNGRILKDGIESTFRSEESRVGKKWKS